MYVTGDSYQTLLLLASLSLVAQPYMRFLFVRPEVCLQLPSDSASRRTPLLFGYTLPTIWACSGLSPVRLCPCRAPPKWRLDSGALSRYMICFDSEIVKCRVYYFCIALFENTGRHIQSSTPSHGFSMYLRTRLFPIKSLTLTCLDINLKLKA